MLRISQILYTLNEQLFDHLNQLFQHPNCHVLYTDKNKISNTPKWKFHFIEPKAQYMIPWLGNPTDK